MVSVSCLGKPNIVGMRFPQEPKSIETSCQVTDSVTIEASVTLFTINSSREVEFLMRKKEVTIYGLVKNIHLTGS